MGGVCSKKPAVKHDVDGPADGTAPNLPHISPLPCDEPWQMRLAPM